MTIRPTVLVLALLASLAFAQAAAAQPITLHVTSTGTVPPIDPDPVGLTKHHVPSRRTTLAAGRR